MNIKIGDLTLEVISLSKVDNMLVIKTNEDVNPYEVAPLFYEHNAISYMDNDDVIETIEGEFYLKYFEQRDGIVTYNIQLPSPLEKIEKRIKEVSDAQTNIELALCEIYENMEV